MKLDKVGFTIKTSPMNKIRCIGLVLLATGILMNFIWSNDVTDFIFGILLGSGLWFLLTGKVKKTNSKV